MAVPCGLAVRIEERIDSEVTHTEVTSGLDWEQIITICNYISIFCVCDVS